MSAGDICYIILAHSDTPQLLRLLAALDPASPKFVHFDARYTGELPEIGRYGAEYVKPRLRCFWGGFSLMDATIGAAELALARCDGRRFVLLSGACFPTKSPDQILRFFEENRGAEFIDFFYLRDGGPKYQTKEQRYWVSEERFEVGPRTRFLAKALARSLTALMRLVPARKPAFADRIAFGSNWWALTRECLEYACTQARSRKDIERFLRWTQSPEELYFHTLIANSPFAAAVRGRKSYVGDGTWRMANLHVVHPSLAKYYSLADMDELLGTDRLFVRKVRSSDGAALCQALLKSHQDMSSSWSAARDN